MQDRSNNAKRRVKMQSGTTHLSTHRRHAGKEICALPLREREKKQRNREGTVRRKRGSLA